LTLARVKLADSPSARFDAEILMAHVLESTRSFLYANPEQELPNPRSEAFKKLVKQRVQGQPIAYLTESSPAAVPSLWRLLQNEESVKSMQLISVLRRSKSHATMPGIWALITSSFTVVPGVHRSRANFTWSSVTHLISTGMMSI